MSIGSKAGDKFAGKIVRALAEQFYDQSHYERGIEAYELLLKLDPTNPTAGECARLLLGAKNEGPCSDTTAAAGSGGMYSTANDMTRWLEYLLGLPGVSVHQAVVLIQATFIAELTVLPVIPMLPQAPYSPIQPK